MNIERRVAKLEAAAGRQAVPSKEEYFAALDRRRPRERHEFDSLARRAPLPPPTEADLRDEAIIEAWNRADYARRGLDYDREMAKRGERYAQELKELGERFAQMLGSSQSPR
jgi:hypothetical protein